MVILSVVNFLSDFLRSFLVKVTVIGRKEGHSSKQQEEKAVSVGRAVVKEPSSKQGREERRSVVIYEVCIVNRSDLRGLDRIIQVRG